MDSDARDLLDAIPHRPPFRLIEEVVESGETRIVARAVPRADDELFSKVFVGHYPGRPITPGALLMEMVFQAAAVLLASRAGAASGGVPVLVRIRDARFRHAVRPDEPLRVEATLVDRVSNAYHFEGTVRSGDRVAVRVAFTCALVTEFT